MEQTKQYEYVDLGLPSGLKWATMNIGAETETDYGDYFMWGSTTPNNDTSCDWEHAPFNNGLRKYDEEYFHTNKSEWLDDKDNLRPEYDAVYKATDGMARMPTQDEFEELFYNTVNMWIEDYNGTKINGMKFTSKINGNSIFIPAAGNCLDGSVYYVGNYGYVWGSSLSTFYPSYAWNLGFGSSNCLMGSYSRCNGRSVRGVRK